MNKYIKPKVVTISSYNPGPTITVLGGVHGNEQSSTAAVKALMNYPPDLIRGKLNLVLANQLAIKQNLRFVEEDLNRCFQETKTKNNSLEEQIAEVLKPILLASDIAIDLHCSTIPDTRTFAICETNAKQVLPYIDIEDIINGFDSYEPGGTDYFMNFNNRIGVCVELGYMTDETVIKKGTDIIRNILSSQNMLNEEAKVYSNQSRYRIQEYFLP